MFLKRKDKERYDLGQTNYQECPCSHMKWISINYLIIQVVPI